jgi:magnesium chelatase family protein
VQERSLARQGCLNAQLEGSALDRHAELGSAERALLARAALKLGLSARAQVRVRRVARTIADAAGAPRIEAPHLAEALAARPVVGA